MDNCVFTEGLPVRCNIDGCHYICSHIDGDGNYVYNNPTGDFTIKAKNNSQFKPQYPLEWYYVVNNKFFDKINPFYRIIKMIAFGDIDEVEFDSQVEHFEIPDGINKESPAYKYFTNFAVCFKEFYEAVKKMYRVQYEIADAVFKKCIPSQTDYQTASNYYVDYYTNVLHMPYKVSNTAAKRIAIADIFNGEIVETNSQKDRKEVYDRLYQKYRNTCIVTISDDKSIVCGYIKKNEPVNYDIDDYDDDEWNDNDD